MLTNNFFIKAKIFFRTWNRLGVNISKRQRFKTIFKPHPEYKKSINRIIEKRHIKKWKQIRKDVNLDTLRICSNISGKQNPNIIPEEIFSSDIEPCLCTKQRKIRYLENKSFYNKWFSNQSVFPKAYLHKIGGIYYDSNYQNISEDEALKQLKKINYPITFKPNIDSYGGKNIFFYNCFEELREMILGKKNFVIQEKILSHDYFKKFNDFGLNTIRVNFYRSVKTNKIHYLHSALRMGRVGKLDNVTSGGIQCYIGDNGYLNEFAVDITGNIYRQHPDSNIVFSKEEKIPLFEEMKKQAKMIAEELYLCRLISLDLCLDDKSNWRIIEINLRDITTEFSQYAGEPFFGEFTDEVIEYCKNNPWWKAPIL